MNLGHPSHIYEEDRNKSGTSNFAFVFGKKVNEDSWVSLGASMKFHNRILGLIDRNWDLFYLVGFLHVIEMD